MHLVACYDVAEDSRRARVFKVLKGYLRPVQKSVFEGHIPSHLIPRLVSEVEAELEPSTDTFRVYRLCGRCAGLIVLAGTAAPVPLEPEDVIV